MIAIGVTSGLGRKVQYGSNPNASLNSIFMLSAIRIAHQEVARRRLACGVYLGLRKAELNALTWANIDFEKKVAHVVNTEDFTTKSGKPRTIPICEELLTILIRYRHIGGFVLAPRKKYRGKARHRWEFRQGFAEMVIDAKLDVRVISPHAMRHTFASILAQRGVSLFKIAAWMGHSTAQVTELYAHLTAYDDDIGRLNKLAPSEKAAVQPAVR